MFLSSTGHGSFIVLSFLLSALGNRVDRIDYTFLHRRSAPITEPRAKRLYIHPASSNALSYGAIEPHSYVPFSERQLSAVASLVVLFKLQTELFH